MEGVILYILLALDLAGFAHGDFSGNATALIAIVLAVVALVTLFMTGRRPPP